MEKQPPFETKENRAEQIKQAVESAVRREMAENHKEDPFHGPHHPEKTLQQGNSFLNEINKIDENLVSEKEELAFRLTALGHDLIIKSSKVADPKAPFGYGQIARFRGWAEDGSDLPPNAKGKVSCGNERASFVRLVEIVKEKDPDSEIYTDEIIKMAEDGVGATYPTAMPAPILEGSEKIKNPETGEVEDISDTLMVIGGQKMALKFDQPHLKKDSGIVALTMGVADISYAGVVSSEQFKEEGDSEFRELNYLIKDYVDEGIDNLDNQTKAWIATQCLNWANTQAGFALMQKIRFNETIENNEVINSSEKAAEIKNKLKEQYNKFDSNIISAAQRKRATDAKYGSLKNPVAFNEPENTELLKDLLGEMGY